jgi:hypothetical protein
MNALDPYEQWRQARSTSEVDPGFTDRVMQGIRQLPSPQRLAEVGPWAVTAAVVAGGLLGAARAACLLAAILLPVN